MSAPKQPEPLPAGGIELRTGFARVRIRERGPVRALDYVWPGGRTVVESRINLARPHKLLEPYLPSLAASLLLVPRPRRMLVLGLGAGNLVRFLEHRHPAAELDAVELDPRMVEIARRWFALDPGPRTRIHVADAEPFLRVAGDPYDLIFVDLALPPSPRTDRDGFPLCVAASGFRRALRARLHAAGAAAFNMGPATVAEAADTAPLESLFPAVYDVRTPRCANRVRIASLAPRADRAELLRSGERLDADDGDPFLSFARLAGRTWPASGIRSAG